MPDPSGERLCPICDSPLQPGSKKCGFCGTDLSIFEEELAPASKASEPVMEAPRVSLENKIEEILRPAAPERPQVVPPVAPPAPKKAEPPKPVPSRAEPVAVPAPEVRRMPEPPKPEPKREPPAPEEAPREYFECPQCGGAVEVTAKSCPKCGVMFAEEGAEVFECPACSTLVPMEATTCPGCGAVFVEEEEAAAAAPQPVPALALPKKEIAAPVAEVRAPPKREERPVPVEAEEEKPAEKGKGFLGLFKRRKEAEAPPAAEKPVVKERPAAQPEPRTEVHAAPTVEVTEVRPTRPEVAPPAVPKPVRAPVVEAPVGKDKGKDLARMVAEMKPILALAREKDIDIGESKKLIDDAAVAGRERQLDRAIALVQQSKLALMGRIDARLGHLVQQLNDEIKVARDFGGDISRATTYIQELARARSSGDAEAAFVYVEKVQKELLPITGRFNEAKKKISSLKQFIANCETFIVDTKEARRLLVDSSKAFDQKDFDKVEVLVKQASESLSKAIPVRMNEEMAKAKYDLIEAKAKNVNITPMLTALKSATNLMKSGDYPQAMKEMRDFREMMKKVA